MTHPLQRTVDFPIFKFCEENNIKCSWDFSKKDGAEWTEIYTNDGENVFQFSDNTTVNVFIDIIKAYMKEYGTKDVENIGDDTMWWAVYSKVAFDKFIEQHKELFNL